MPQAGLGYEQRGGRAPELVLEPRAVELGDQHASAVGKAQGDGQEEEDERGAAAHGGEHGVRYLLRRPAVAADDDAVHRVVQLLQNWPAMIGSEKSSISFHSGPTVISLRFKSSLP